MKTIQATKPISQMSNSEFLKRLCSGNMTVFEVHDIAKEAEKRFPTPEKARKMRRVM